MSGLPEGGHGCAAASHPGSARAHASDDNSGKSFRINIDLGCGPSPAYGPLHGTCSALCFCSTPGGGNCTRGNKNGGAVRPRRSVELVGVLIVTLAGNTIERTRQFLRCRTLITIVLASF